MAKYVFYASTGYVGADQREEVEIPDNELEGKTESEIDEYIDKNYYQDWLTNNVEFGFWKKDQ